jgi:signal transduction histidine kinase
MIRRVATCRNFETEVRAALAAEGLAGVELQLLEGSCDGGRTSPAEPPAPEPGTLRLGGACAWGPGDAADLDSCFALLLGRDLADRFLGQGLHLLTPRMLAEWQTTADTWGFAPETARQFYGESIRGFRVVDCGVAPIDPAAVAGLSAFAGVPVDIWPASLEVLRLRLRLALAPFRAPGGGAGGHRMSDLAMVFDLVADLLARPCEADLAQGIVDLFTVLCAPAGVTLQLSPAGAEGPRTASAPPGHRPAPGRERLLETLADSAPVGEDGFLLVLGGAGGAVGALLVERVAFPDRRDHYLGLGATLAPVLALVLSDLRRREREVEERSRRESESRTRAILERAKEDLEIRVRERTVELEAANRELETFSYSVSHDLRAPLRAMSGFSGALIQDFGADLPDKAKDYLRIIDDASRRMAALIEGILTLSRNARAELRRDWVDLSAAAGRVLADLARQEPDRSVAASVEPGLRAYGDPRLLEAVLANLLGNAWKYTGGTGGAEIRVSGEQRDGRRWIAVADNGAGFDMASADMLFKPFKRLHRQDEFPGLGIGLATVERIIRRHGGEIQADGAPGRGATFRFMLPDDGRDG